MSKTQLYRWFDKDDNLLYVGISYSAVNRAKEHSKTSHWYDEAVRMTLENYESRKDALKAECMAIKEENPIHNKSRHQSYLLFKEYGFDSVAEFIEHRNKTQAENAYQRQKLKKLEERDNRRMKELIRDCEFLVFYKDNWQACLDKNRLPAYPRFDWLGVEKDFNTLLEIKHGKGVSWFGQAEGFARFRNSKERLKMYTEFHELCMYEDIENGLRRIWYCDYGADKVLCDKAGRLSELLRQGYNITLSPPEGRRC